MPLMAATARTGGSFSGGAGLHDGDTGDCGTPAFRGDNGGCGSGQGEARREHEMRRWPWQHLLQGTDEASLKAHLHVMP